MIRIFPLSCVPMQDQVAQIDLSIRRQSTSSDADLR